MKDLLLLYEKYIASYNDIISNARQHPEETISIIDRIQIKIDHTSYEHMLEEFNDNIRHQEKKKMELRYNFFRMAGNEHMIIYKDIQQSLCAQKCGHMYNGRI